MFKSTIVSAASRRIRQSLKQSTEMIHKLELVPRELDRGVNYTQKESVHLEDIYANYNPSSTLHVSLPSNKRLNDILKQVGYVENEGLEFDPSILTFLSKPVDFPQMYRTIVRGTKYPSQSFVEKIKFLEAYQADPSVATPVLHKWLKKSRTRFQIYALADFAMRVINTHDISAKALEGLVQFFLAIPEKHISRNSDIPFHASDFMKSWFSKYSASQEELEDEEKLHRLRSIQQLDVDLAGLREFYYDMKDNMDSFVIRMYHVLVARNIEIADNIETEYFDALLRSKYSHDAVALVVNRVRNGEVVPEYIEKILPVIPETNASPLVPYLLRVLQLARGYESAEETFASLPVQSKLALISAFHRSDVMFDKEVAFQRFKVLMDPVETRRKFFSLYATEKEKVDGFVHTPEYRNQRFQAIRNAVIAAGKFTAEEFDNLPPEQAFAYEENYNDLGYLGHEVIDLKKEQHIEQLFKYAIEPFDGETNVEKFDQYLRSMFDKILIDFPDLTQQYNPERAITNKFPIATSQLEEGSPSIYLLSQCINEQGVEFLGDDFKSFAEYAKTPSNLQLNFRNIYDPCIASTILCHVLYEMAYVAKNLETSTIQSSLTIQLPIDRKLQEYYNKTSSLKNEILKKDPVIQGLLNNLENKLSTPDIVSEETFYFYTQINNRIADLATEIPEADATLNGSDPFIVDKKYVEMVMILLEHYKMDGVVKNDAIVISPESISQFVKFYNNGTTN